SSRNRSPLQGEAARKVREFPGREKRGDPVDPPQVRWYRGPNSKVVSQAFLPPGSAIVNFADRVVLVTGASRGIGRVIAQEFARSGARVAVHYHRDRDAAEQTRATLPGGPHTIVQADLANAEAAEPLIAAVVRDLGRLDIVVNNAGIYEQHPILEVDYLKW